MENVSDNLSIRERMKRAAELRSEYGAEIPQDLLNEINYVSIEDEDGQLILMTAELFAKKSLEKKIAPKTKELPFETLSFSVDSSSEIGARVPLNVLRNKIEDTYLKLGYTNYNHNDAWRPLRKSITERFPQLAQYETRFEVERSRIAAGYLGLPEPSDIDAFDDLRKYGGDILTDIATDICHNHQTEMTDYEDLRSIHWNTDNNHVPSTTAERIFKINQYTRSHITDVAETKPYVYPAFDRGTGFAGLEFEDAAGEWLCLPDNITGWDISKQALTSLLEEDNFTATAELVKQAETFDDVVTIIDSPSISDRIKQLKNELKGLNSDTLDPHERFAQQSKIKKQIKTAQQSISSLRQLLHFEQTYAEYATPLLNNLDEALLQKSPHDSVVVELDARPDKEKDANPGKMSGDCTENMPLPFGIEPGLVNIKVAISGEYTGNIYSYQTTSDDSLSVWHFDAIQIPSRTIDWDTFPAKFIQTIEEIARDKNIDVITINSKQYHISNYDYVAKGFMKYLQAETLAVEYENMEQPDAADVIEGDNIETISIKFPEKQSDDHYSQLQGAVSGQIVLWKNPSTNR